MAKRTSKRASTHRGVERGGREAVLSSSVGAALAPARGRDADRGGGRSAGAWRRIARHGAISSNSNRSSSTRSASCRRCFCSPARRRVRRRWSGGEAREQDWVAFDAETDSPCFSMCCCALGKGRTASRDTQSIAVLKRYCFALRQVSRAGDCRACQWGSCDNGTGQSHDASKAAGSSPAAFSRPSFWKRRTAFIHFICSAQKTGHGIDLVKGQSPDRLTSLSRRFSAGSLSTASSLVSANMDPNSEKNSIIDSTCSRCSTSRR